MKKSHVDVVFDRKKKVAKNGKGLAEYRLYLARGVRKYIPIAEITPAEWEHFTESIVIQEQLTKYDQMLSAIEYLGKPLTLESLNESLGVEPRKSKATLLKEEQAKKAKSKDSFILFFYDQLAAEKIQRRTVQAREVDAQLFDFNTMTEKEGDLYYIDGKRLKTGSTVTPSALHPEGEKPRDWVFTWPFWIII